MLLQLWARAASKANIIVKILAKKNKNFGCQCKKRSNRSDPIVISKNVTTTNIFGITLGWSINITLDGIEHKREPINLLNQFQVGGWMGTGKDSRIENSSTKYFSLDVEEELARWATTKMKILISLKETIILSNLSWLW